MYIIIFFYLSDYFLSLYCLNINVRQQCIIYYCIPIESVVLHAKCVELSESRILSVLVYLIIEIRISILGLQEGYNTNTRASQYIKTTGHTNGKFQIGY